MRGRRVVQMQDNGLSWSHKVRRVKICVTKRDVRNVKCSMKEVDCLRRCRKILSKSRGREVSEGTIKRGSYILSTEIMVVARNIDRENTVDISGLGV